MSATSSLLDRTLSPTNLIDAINDEADRRADWRTRAARVAVRCLRLKPSPRSYHPGARIASSTRRRLDRRRRARHPLSLSNARGSSPLAISERDLYPSYFRFVFEPVFPGAHLGDLSGECSTPSRRKAAAKSTHSGTAFRCLNWLASSRKDGRVSGALFVCELMLA